MLSRGFRMSRRLLRTVCSTRVTNHHQLQPLAAPFSIYNDKDTSFLCTSNQINPAADNDSFHFSFSIYSRSRKFCTMEAIEIEKNPDLGDHDEVDKIYKTILDHSNPDHNMEGALSKLELALTTPLVIGVLHRFRFEEKLAFRFFTWAGHQEHYTHEPEAFNTIIDILSSTKYKIKQFRIVCDLLDCMKRRNGNRSIPIEALQTILRNYTEKHLSHLQKFAKKKKIRVKTQPEINAFNLLLDALCKCCLVEEAESMFVRVKTKVKPNVDTYNILFFGWCRVRNPSRAMSVLQEMIDMGHTPENFTYNTAVETFCRVGLVADALKLLEFMKKNGSHVSSPTAKTFVIVMVSLAENDRMEECYRILEDMIGGGYLPDVSTYKDFVEGMCLAGKIESCYKFLEEMGRTSYPPDIVTYNCFLKVLCDNKKRDDALRLFEKMVEAGCEPSVQSYNFLIKMFFRMGDLEGAFGTWRNMEKRDCARDSDTYCVMIEGLFGCGETKDGIFLVEEVIDRGVKLPYGKFDAFLMHLSSVGDLGLIHRLSDHMRKFYNHAMARRFAVSQKRKSVSLRDR